MKLWNPKEWLRRAKDEKVRKLEENIVFLQGINEGLVYLNTHLKLTMKELREQALRIMATLVLKQGGKVLVEKEFFETVNTEEKMKLRIQSQEESDTVLFEIVNDEAEAETIIMSGTEDEESSVHTGQ